MSERKTGKEFISKGEILFLSHPGKDSLFSGYGLSTEEGRGDKLVGLLMVDRPKPADPAWLVKLHEAFGGIQLIPMTKTGERGIVCRMQIKESSKKYLTRSSSALAKQLKDVLEPLLEYPPKPSFILEWNEVRNMWESKIVP